MSTKRLFKIFLVWRLSLFAILIFAIIFIPLQNNFLGGGLKHYNRFPWLWSWVNYDGEHYLAIAQRGYRSLEYFFFPLYPTIIGLFSKIFSNNTYTLAIIGLIISNLSFFISLIGLQKLISLDHKKNISKLSIILLLLFPTSFYFGSYYTESLFFSLTIWSFYTARKQKFLLASLLAAFATFTRITGLILFPALLTELLLQKKYRRHFQNYVYLLLIPLALFCYMYFLYLRTSDPLEFLHSVELFGAQRSSKLILLPQVFYRYFFKILPNLSLYWPAILTTILELFTSLLFLFIIIFSFTKIRISYWIYLLGGYILPTLSGSFSSLPRYVIILFPAFIFMAIYLDNHKHFKKIFISIFAFLLVIFTSMFLRGFWVS